MIFLYGAFELAQSVRHPESIINTGSDSQAAQMLVPYQNLVQLVVIAFYATVMFVAILGPGLTAVYYYSRVKYIDAYLQQTPAWILELQRGG